MAFKVQVGPPQISIHQGQTILISELDGQIKWPSEKGLFFRDTRVVSSWAIYANGEPWDLLNGGAITYYAARMFLPIAPFRRKMARYRHARSASLLVDGSVAACTRTLKSQQQHEPSKVPALYCHPQRYADLFEVKSNCIVRRGRITTEWSRHDGGIAQPIATATSRERSRSLRRNHRARRRMPMVVSALKSNWGLENVGIPASYTRWKMASRV